MSKYWSHGCAHTQRILHTETLPVALPTANLSESHKVLDLYRTYFLRSLKQMQTRTFPGDSLVKNPAANAGGTGLIPDPRRPHAPRSNECIVPPRPSLCLAPGSRSYWRPRAPEPVLNNEASAVRSPRPPTRKHPVHCNYRKQ